MEHPVFLRRVQLSNYKSIKECSVSLGPLTFLIGQNGAGKSNFLDAIRLVTEALNTSLEHALRERGGINEVRRRSSGHPTHFGVRLDWQLPNGVAGFYAFRVGSQKKGGFEIQREACRVYRPDGVSTHHYHVENGQLVEQSFPVGPPASNDRLYLVAAAGLEPFRPVYDALANMGFYSLNPEMIRELQPPDAGKILKRDGSNLASVLRVLEREYPETHDKVVTLLSQIVPGIKSIEVVPAGKKEMIEFRQVVGTSKDPWRFSAENMSDGTLRALGILTALFQSPAHRTADMPFVGIEEPEVALHPGAAGILRDSLKSASVNTQVVATSHSPDLLDDKSITESEILVVMNQAGESRIAPLAEAQRSAIRDRLYTVGEMLRMDQLAPDPAFLQPSRTLQLDLFDEGRP